MSRYAAAALLLGFLSGCMNLDTGVDSGGMRPLQAQGMRPLNGGPPTVPGLQGANGLPVPMAAPYSYAPPMNEYMARSMMANNMPMNMMQMNPRGGMPGMPMSLSPVGMPGAPGAMPGGTGMPTSSQLMTPGPGMAPDGGIQQAQYAMNPATSGVPQPGQRTQVRFTRPAGMQVSWYAMGPDGRPLFSPTPIDTPGKYNFLQGARYRLKLTNIPGRPGLELYPTLEVVPANHKAEAFLAHSSVPLEFSEQDFKQVADGNYLVKVVYLPDPNFQDVAGTGTDEIVSTTLEPGQDPIQEALRRGSILLVIRMGNIDQEAPNTPPLSTPGPVGVPPAGMPPMMGLPPMGAPPMGAPGKFGPTQPGILTAPLQVPNWGMGPTGPFAPPGHQPGAMPTGPVPPGLTPPPGAIPPGAIPPGTIPPGAMPPGLAPPPGALPPPGLPSLPPGLPPGTTAPALPMPPVTRAPTAAIPPATGPHDIFTPAPLTPLAPAAANSLAPSLPPVPSEGTAGAPTTPITPALPPVPSKQ